MNDIQSIDFNVDLLKALLWQYNTAEKLESILRSKQDWYDAEQRDFWEKWLVDVFDLRTCNEFGLTVWSIILGQPLGVDIGGDPVGKPIWGFGQYHKNFTNGNFTVGNDSFVQLSSDQKRIILRLRYYQLITRGTVPEANKYVRDVLGTGVYVLDGLNMTAEYIFTSAIPSNVLFLLENYDILPRPAGVRVSYSVIAEDTWGFGEYHANFNNGNFAQ